MKLENWVTEWEHTKRSFAVDVDEYQCPYDNIACVVDGCCVQCKMDKVTEQYCPGYRDQDRINTRR